MTQAILALDEQHDRDISMHTSDDTAQRKWAEHESQKVLCTWRYALKLFRKLKTPLAPTGTEAQDPPRKLKTPDSSYVYITQLRLL